MRRQGHQTGTPFAGVISETKFSPKLILEQIRLNPGHILQPRSSVGIPAA